MLDLQRIIVLCLPSLLFAATMEPGTWMLRAALINSSRCCFPANNLRDCFKVSYSLPQFNVVQGFFSHQLWRIGTDSILDSFAKHPWAILVSILVQYYVMRCFNVIEIEKGGRNETTHGVVSSWNCLSKSLEAYRAIPWAINYIAVIFTVYQSLIPANYLPTSSVRCGTK